MSKVATNDVNDHKSFETLRWLSGFVRSVPKHVLGILSFSLAVNLLMLVSPLYMLQVYDRILSSGSLDTLLWLSAIAIFLLGIYSAAEAGRRRVLSLAGDKLETIFAPRIFRRFESGRDTQPALAGDVANLSRIQNLLQSGAMLAFFDLPFTPLFIGLLFLLDPILGFIGVAGGIAVFIVALVSEFATRGAGKRAAAATSQAQTFITGVSRQRSAVVAMGLTQRLFGKWRETRDYANEQTLSAAKGDGTFSALARTVRQILQVLILGVGAALALSQQISPGGIVAGSVIMSRALAPIDQIVGAWRTLVMARTSWSELSERLEEHERAEDYTPLPKPEAHLRMDRVAIAIPGSTTPLVRPFTYDVASSSMVAIVGANGSGKTTLLQTLAGAWPADAGSITLGGRSLHDWASNDRGQYIGYVPQGVELSPGTVTENISRFSKDRLEEVFAASRSVAAHEMIMSLPKGYDTLIGPGGVHLSAGQRQLIGLARAFFADPVLLLLDEPTANLDSETASAIITAIEAHCRKGAIVFASTHDINLIERMDVALIIRGKAILSVPAKDYTAASKVVDALPKLKQVAK